MKYSVLLLVTLLLQVTIFLNPNDGYAETQRPNVNILAWWGYLDDPTLIARTEKTCNVKISHDIYYSNDEFLRRWRGSEENYDIIIFTESIYHSAQPNLPQIDTPLWKEAYEYNPIIRSHYFKKEFPHNVVYYAHALTGFLWNKSLITINPTDSFQKIFSQPDNHTVAVIDDPLEIKLLIDSGLFQNKNTSIDKSISAFNHIETLFNNSKIIPINNYRQLSTQKDIAIIFTWSGEAIEGAINHSDNWEFTINQNLSQISSDLLAQTKKSNAALCVAQHLTSKPEMSFMQNNSFYFSPYLDDSKVTNKHFRKIYTDFLQLLPNIKWLSSINDTDLKKLNTAWAITKIRLTREINE